MTRIEEQYYNDIHRIANALEKIANKECIRMGDVCRTYNPDINGVEGKEIINGKVGYQANLKEVRC